MPVNKASIDWTKVKNKPSTISEFGITDALANGQTWQDLTASRAMNTTYTNTSGKPITVILYVADTTATSLVLTIAGIIVKVGVGLPGQNSSGTWIVPAGATYAATVTAGSGSVITWCELR